MQPMLATRGERVPTGADWIHEVKWDGMRVLVEVSAERVRAFSRTENDVSAAFPELAELASVGARVGRSLLLDGEVVSLGEGVPSFAALADRIHVRDPTRAARLAAQAPVTLLAFDVLRLGDDDLLAHAHRERRQVLEDLGIDLACCQVPATYDDGPLLLTAAEQQGLEGIVSKRRSSRYHPGRRSKDWLKFPIRPTGSYVVAGYRHETGSTRRLGALLLGEPTAEGLRFRGRVGAGLAGAAGQRLLDALVPLQRETSPFAEEVPRVDRAGAVWVEPEIVVDVAYLTLTPDGRLRQPAYRGVRADLTPADLETS